MEGGDPRAEFATVVKNCARCGENHLTEFIRFKRPCGEFSHWGWCQKAEAPILLKIEHVTK